MAEPVDKDLTRHPVWGAAAEPERPNPFADLFPVVEATETMDVPTWVEANLRLRPEVKGPLDLSPAFLKALAEPGVRVRFLTPAELRRLNGPSVFELLEMLRVIEAGGQVLAYEPVGEGEA